MLKSFLQESIYFGLLYNNGYHLCWILRFLCISYVNKIVCKLQVWLLIKKFICVACKVVYSSCVVCIDVIGLFLGVEWLSSSNYDLHRI